MLLGFSVFSVMLAVLYNVIRRHVFHDGDDVDSTFDAGGNVSTSLTAVTIASQLLWPGDMLQSATVAVKVRLSVCRSVCPYLPACLPACWGHAAKCNRGRQSLSQCLLVCLCLCVCLCVCHLPTVLTWGHAAKCYRGRQSMSASWSVCVSVCLCLYVCLAACLPACLPACLSVCLSV